MATGSGKTFTAANFTYRLAKFAKAKRILFLVDRGNLGRQARKEFQQFVTPGRRAQVHRAVHRPAPELERARPDREGRHQHHPARSTRCSRARRSSRRRPTRSRASRRRRPSRRSRSRSPTTRTIPIETFDVIVTDECHRSIYNLWRQVLEYFDAFLIGLTATPSKQTLGFFNQNLVMEYDHEQAVADGVNVDFDVYEIRTEITQAGSKVDAGLFVDKRDRQTRDEALGAARRGPRLRRQPARPRRRRPGPAAHGHPHVPRQALHRDLPRPDRGAQDPDLRQGRQPRRGHRAGRARGVRQGQRLLRQDHLQDHRRQARGPARRASATATTRGSP